MQAKQEFYYVHVTVLSGRERRCESENREKKRLKEHSAVRQMHKVSVRKIIDRFSKKGISSLYTEHSSY